MKDREDLKLKAELEEIMKSVDNIMKKVETVMPEKEEDAQPQSE
jgi:tetrahydromethanopterin S-methyltransferase subunit G